MSNYYEDTMPLSTNKDEYLKYYIDDSLPMFDKLNIIIKKGQSFQRQALITNLNAYVRDPLFTSLIQFIISDISTWDADSIILFPKSLYKVIINNILDNELFNIIFKYIIINVSTGADVTKNEYTYYFDKIIEFYSPTKDEVDYGDKENIKKDFPYIINDDIFEFIISLGKFGKSAINRRLSVYLSSSLCRLIIKDDSNIQDENTQKLYTRLSYLFCDTDKIIEAQMVRELKYIIPIFKDIMFSNEDIYSSIELYITHDTDVSSQCSAIKALINNIIYIEKQNKLVDKLLLKIKEIIEAKDYGINRKNDIMNTLINSLYINHKLIPKIVNSIFDYGIIEYYIQNFDSIESINIFIKNFDKIFFLLNTYEENYNKNENNTESNTNFSFNINHQMQFTPQAEVKLQNKIQFDEFFIKIYNKIYNNFESSESSSSNLLLLEASDSNISKDGENNILNCCKKLLFKYLAKILHCLLIYIKNNKQLGDAINDLFKNENIINILNYYYNEPNKNGYDSEKNEFFSLLSLIIENNYMKYLNNANNNNINYCKEFVYENNYFNKLYLLIINNIYNQFQELQKNSNSHLCLLIANTLNLLIPKLYKYYKNIVIVNNNNNFNYIVNNNSIDINGKNDNDKIYYLEKNYDEIFTKILSVIITNKNIGDFIKKEFVQIMPNLILYSKNRNKYLKFMKKEIIKSNNFFFRKYSIDFIKKCLEIFSFDFIYKIHIYDDILSLMKDKINIISTGVIELIYKYNKKIIAYSPEVFKDICEVLNDIYNLNIKAFNNDIKNFDKDKNIIINQIFNIRGSNDSFINNKINNFYPEDELSSTRDNENNLSGIENEILNFENNHKKNKNIKNINSQIGIFTNKNNYDLNGNILQQINSTSSSFQEIKSNNNNNINNTLSNEYKYLGQINNNLNIFNQIPFNSRGNTKKHSISDKSSSNIMKSLTFKNIINNKHYLPKIKGQKNRKDSNCSNNSGNNNNNIYPIKNNAQISNNSHKNGTKEKDKIILKTKNKLIPCSHNRTPSAKMCQGNLPINNNGNSNFGYDDISNKNSNYKVNNKSVSNKNVVSSIRPHTKAKTYNYPKDNIHRNISSKICINAEEGNATNIFLE